MRRYGIITQARTTSTRLPGKILLKLDGAPVLHHHTKRLQWSGIPVYIATTSNETDQPVADLANALGLPFHRGDEHHVLQRFYECAKKFELEVVIRVTSDCPLIDGRIIAQGLEEYRKLDNPNVYYSNCLVRTFPRGLDFEIFSFHLLEEAYRNATLESEREHVTPYIYKNSSGKIACVHHTAAENHSELRWTLDTEEDFKLLKILFEDHKVADLPYLEILDIVQNHPELANINKHIQQKEIKL